MIDDQERQRYREYQQSLPEGPLLVFAWSGRLLTPRVLHDGEVVREAFGTVKARTWAEAAITLALAQEAATPDQWVDDVILRQVNLVALAWSRRQLGAILDNESLLRLDNPQETTP